MFRHVPEEPDASIYPADVMAHLRYYPIIYPAGLIKPTTDLSEIFGMVGLPL